MGVILCCVQHGCCSKLCTTWMLFCVVGVVLCCVQRGCCSVLCTTCVLFCVMYNVGVVLCCVQLGCCSVVYNVGVYNTFSAGHLMVGIVIADSQCGIVFLSTSPQSSSW